MESRGLETPERLHAMQAHFPAKCRKNERFPAFLTFHRLQGSQGFARIPGILLQLLLQLDLGYNSARSRHAQAALAQEFGNIAAQTSSRRGRERVRGDEPSGFLWTISALPQIG